MYCSRVMATTRYWFRVRLRLGGLKLQLRFTNTPLIRIICIVITHKCRLLGNTNINWDEMACIHCIIMPNAQLKLGAQKYEFVIRTSNSESMLSGTGDVHCEFMCSERLKDEVEQFLKLSFFNVYSYKFSVVQIQVIIYHYSVVGQSDHSEISLIP